MKPVFSNVLADMIVTENGDLLLQAICKRFCSVTHGKLRLGISDQTSTRP